MSSGRWSPSPAVCLRQPPSDELAGARELLERIIDQDIDEDPADGGDRRSDKELPGIGSCRWSILKCATAARAIPDGWMVTRPTCSPNTITNSSSASSPRRRTLRRTRTAALSRRPKTFVCAVTEVLGDTAYGDGDTRAAVEAAGAKITAKTQPQCANRQVRQDRLRRSIPKRSLRPVRPATPPPRVRQARDSKNEERRRVNRRGTLRRLLRSANAAPRVPNGRGCRRHEARLQAARAEQQRPSTRHKLRRRSLVERKLAELKIHGIGKARSAANAKCCSNPRLTAAPVNLKKLFTLEIPTLHPCYA